MYNMEGDKKLRFQLLAKVVPYQQLITILECRRGYFQPVVLATLLGKNQN